MARETQSQDVARAAGPQPLARDVPYVPTDDAVVAAMLRFAGVTENDRLYDLGCGDGRIVIAAARRFGARGVGVDIDPARIIECEENARRAGVTDRVQFFQKSLFDIDLAPATVLALYLLPGLNIRLRPKMLAQMSPGARVIANHFDMGDWQPDEVLLAHHRKLMRWIIPADVAGHWHCTINDPAGRRHIALDIAQRFQILTGYAAVAGHRTMIGLGRMDGDQISFRLVEWGRSGAIMRYRAMIEGKQLRGHCWREDRPSEMAEWGGEKA